MSHELATTRSALAARYSAVDDPDKQVHGLTPELAANLVAAVFMTPKLSVACALCGVQMRTVRGWITSGAVHGAIPLLATFSADMYEAEAIVVKGMQAKLDRLIAIGSPTAKLQLDLMRLRIPSLDEEESVSSILANGVDKKQARASLLADPPPAMIAELHAQGWFRKTEWPTE